MHLRLENKRFEESELLKTNNKAQPPEELEITKHEIKQSDLVQKVCRQRQARGNTPTPRTILATFVFVRYTSW